MHTSELIERAPRHDGWTTERKARFLDSLAAKGNVRLACRRVNLSPEAAYRLKRRDALFARGWAAALVLARDSGLEELADRALDGIEEPVWYRGKLLGTRRRYDSRLLLAHLARLDKAAEDKAAQVDAGRFDELVACIAGEFVPPGLADKDDLLPLDRLSAGLQAANVAEEELHRIAEEAGGDEAEAVGPSADACIAAYREGRLEGEARWDAWFDNACGYVDWLTGWDLEPPLPGLPGNPLPERLEQALDATASAPCASPAKAFPRTLSNASTSALARGLAGSMPGLAAAPRSPLAARHAAPR